ncbi:MAG TPA: polysaccharide biosynthesis protein [Clostridiales bacterium]|nr:polysaccharide biosynthesis protein [Clostridiales bacterium]
MYYKKRGGTFNKQRWEQTLRNILKKSLLIIRDVCLVNAALILALILRFDILVPSGYIELYKEIFWLYTLVMILVYHSFGLYSSLWKYSATENLITIIISTTISNAIIAVPMFIIGTRFPRTVYLLTWLINIVLIGGVHFGANPKFRRYFYLRRKNGDKDKKVLIVGAGEAGAMVIKELKAHRELGKVPVAVVDDDAQKHGWKICGVPVLAGRAEIPKIVKTYDISEIIIAIPSASQQDIKDIVHICRKVKCTLKTLPGVYEIIDGKVSLNQIRDVRIEDLLGREPVELDSRGIREYIQGKCVLVTGGGGSIGSELCRQIVNYNPLRLIVLDIYENSVYELQNELLRRYPDLDLEILIGSIRDRARMDSIFKIYKPNVVFHAAAHKHVPLMENNPAEAIKNNVFGTFNVAEAADKYGCERFVLISTDKAVNPTNIMGASKRLAEIIIQSMAKHSKTRFAAVRFGNVLGSNGSVIPLFKKQIEEGGPVTVTHPEINRFFMTVSEAVQLVMQAGAFAKGGEIFVLDMGRPVKIVDLARDLIRLSGFEPDRDIKIEFTGLRPGEKLYEELLTAEEGLSATSHRKIFICQPTEIDSDALKKELEKLKYLLVGSNEMLMEFMEKLVPTYRRVI